MAYSVSKVTNYRVKDNTNYFLDANIWLKVLCPKIPQEQKDRSYRQLFDEILRNNNCKIIVTSLVLSEVINRIMRDVHMAKYIAKIKETNPSFTAEKEFFKETFRPTLEYKMGYKMICEEIKNYNDSITFVDDGLEVDISSDDILLNTPQNIDFNDFYYFNLSKKRDYVIITDDRDFWLEDVEIVTLSTSLINKINNYHIEKHRSKILS